MAKLSIIITLTKRDEIQNSLASLLLQNNITTDDIELVLINNGLEERDYIHYMQNLNSMYSNIKIVTEKQDINDTNVLKRNINNCQGNYIILIRAEDFFSSKWISGFIYMIDNFNKDIYNNIYVSEVPNNAPDTEIKDILLENPTLYKDVINYRFKNSKLNVFNNYDKPIESINCCAFSKKLLIEILSTALDMNNFNDIILKHQKSNKLSFGSGTYYRLPDSKYLNLKNNQLRKINIVTGTACNLDCEYCFYHHEKKTMMSAETLDETYEFIKRMKDKHPELYSIEIVGGEVTMSNRVMDFIKKIAQELSLHILIFTNLSVDLRNFFESLNEKERDLFQLHISMHKKDLEKNKCMDTWINNIKYLKNNKIRHNVTSVFLPWFTDKDITEYLSLSKKYEFNIYWDAYQGMYNDKYFPEAFEHTTFKSKDFYNKTERRYAFFGKIDEMKKKLNIPEYDRNPPQRSLKDINHKYEEYAKCLNSTNKLIDQKKLYCTAGYYYIHVDYRGIIRRCATSVKTMGHVKDDFEIYKEIKKCGMQYCECPVSLEYF